MVVLGGGTIGQLTSQAAMAAGAAQCWIVDPAPFRRTFAELHSSVRAIAPDELDTALRDLAAPGIDSVVECSGAASQLARALEVVRPGGTVVAVGLHSGEQPIPVPALVLAERTLVGSAAHLWDVDVTQAVQLLADGRFNVDDLITHEVQLADLVTRALPLLSTTTEVLKVAIRCS
jgi:threonine dehydrogenase-like Zn-dependent dehydrogenase